MINLDLSGKKANRICIVLLTLALTTSLPLLANNISIDGTVTLTDQNNTEDYTNIKFDISWENSWRTNDLNGDGITNWDAAWVFAKWKLTSGSVWSYCTLNTSGHTAPSGSVVENPISDNPQTGVFIYRSTDGTGSVDWDNAKLRWNYGTDLVADDATVDVKVFAIEMVYVPQGAFYAGDNATSNASLKQGSSDSDPWYVNDSEAMVMNGVEFYYVSGGNSGEDVTGSSFTIPADFPNGFAAFYCMKYEISQGQYADFLNTLTGTQDGNRYYSTTSYRYTIGGSAGSRIASVPNNRACNYLSWADGAAYSDWAGLRPMTELEFEKACRGTKAAVAGEYAWGSTIVEATTISGAENGTETVNGNCNYSWGSDFSGGDGGRGPLRCGIFAKSGTSRQDAGASYYGVMEMSGNLWERAVTLGNATGRTFTGTHGNGELEGGGNADIEYWPGTNASGAGFRGGNWGNIATYLPVSYRRDAAYTSAARNRYFGFRSARTK